MWKQGGRSAALDRAEALLCGKRSGRGAAEAARGSTAQTPEHAGAAPPNVHTLLSDLSDLSSGSSAPGLGADSRGPAAAGNTQGGEGGHAQDLRPPSSLGGGGSRFLKKAPPPAASRSQSPGSRSRTQQGPEPRYVSSQRGSQTAALSRLAQIESRIRSRKQAQEEVPKPADTLTSDLEISPVPAAQSLEAPVQVSAQSSSEQSLKGKRFLKNKTALAVDSSNTPGSPEGPDSGVRSRSRSRAAGAVVSLAGLETKAAGGVSLESDEEDMKKLLGDSLDSMDNSFLMPRRPSSRRTAAKMLSRNSQKDLPTPPSPPVPPPLFPTSASPRSPASPRRGSPFRFTGQAQAHFSPSVLSSSPSPPRVSPSPPGGVDSPCRTESPQRSLSSMSGGGAQVLSLEELFPVGPGSEDPHSEMSSVFSEDFKINVMTLDDLVPAEPGMTAGEEREAKHSAPVSAPPSRPQQLLGLKKTEEQQQEQQQQQKEVHDYQSDFESESRTEPDGSASQVSEHLLGRGDAEEVSKVREEASDPDVSCGRTEDDYSSSFSDTSRSYTSLTSGGSRTGSRSRSSRSSVSRDSRRCASTRKAFKEAAVQTQPAPLTYTGPSGTSAVDPDVGLAYMRPSPAVTHALSAEVVEALSTFNPAVFALNEMLKQQLAMTRRFIESSRHLHSSLVQSLEPPDYRYTTLEDTKEYIRRHRPPRLTVEEALDHHHT